MTTTTKTSDLMIGVYLNAVHVRLQKLVPDLSHDVEGGCSTTSSECWVDEVELAWA